jgi:hypothetical protein
MRCANNGQVIRFALLFDQTGQGCDVGAIPHLPSTGQSNSLMGMTVVSGHELLEMMTDPDGNSWLVSPPLPNGVTEIADLCAWRFGLVTLSDSKQWLVQPEWDNAVGCTFTVVTKLAVGTTCSDGSSCASGQTCCCTGSTCGCKLGSGACSFGSCGATQTPCGPYCIPLGGVCCKPSVGEYCPAGLGKCCVKRGKDVCGGC